MSKINCPTCKKEIPENAKYCLECGAEITEEQRKTGKEANIKKGAGCGLVVLLILVVVYVIGLSSDTEFPKISESTAKVICGNAFENAAKYDSDYSIMDATTFELKDSWVVKIPGKMQNAFGAWRKVVVHCKCLKDNPNPKDQFTSQAVVELEVMPQ